MTRHEHRIRKTAGRAVWRVLAAATAVTAALAGGVATSTALADEPQKCGMADTVCYAGYNANGLRKIADDLSLNGTGSRYYTTMETDLQKDVRGSITLSDGSKLPFRLIGILHDDLADGSGRKAGLTFMSVNAMPKAYCMEGNDHGCTADYNSNTGGWRDRQLREWMNKGEIWNMFPTAFQNNVSTVVKQSNNMKKGNTPHSAASATSDRLWLISYRELVPTIYDGWKQISGFQALRQEGSQYEFFKGRVTNNHSSNTILANMSRTASGSTPADCSFPLGWWERSVNDFYTGFQYVDGNGNPAEDTNSSFKEALVPAFSF